MCRLSHINSDRNHIPVVAHPGHSRAIKRPCGFLMWSGLLSVNHTAVWKSGSQEITVASLLEGRQRLPDHPMLPTASLCCLGSFTQTVDVKSLLLLLKWAARLFADILTQFPESPTTAGLVVRGKTTAVCLNRLSSKATQ